MSSVAGKRPRRYTSPTAACSIRSTRSENNSQAADIDMEHAPTKKKFHLTVLIEFLVTAGLGIYFHRVLHWQKEAYFVLAIGLLLTLATYLLADEIARSRERVSASYHRSHGLLSSLSL